MLKSARFLLFIMWRYNYLIYFKQQTTFIGFSSDVSTATGCLFVFACILLPFCSYFRHPVIQKAKFTKHKVIYVHTYTYMDQPAYLKMRTFFFIHVCVQINREKR